MTAPGPRGAARGATERTGLGRFTVTGACVGCGACLRTCPAHAIRPVVGGPAPLVVLAGCVGCGECGEVCPVDACVPALPRPAGSPAGSLAGSPAGRVG